MKKWSYEMMERGGEDVRSPFSAIPPQALYAVLSLSLSPSRAL